MRAGPSNGEKLVTLSGYEDRFTKRVPCKHCSLRDFFNVTSLLEIRAFQLLRCFRHKSRLESRFKNAMRADVPIFASFHTHSNSTASRLLGTKEEIAKELSSDSPRTLLRL